MSNDVKTVQTVGVLDRAPAIKVVPVYLIAFNSNVKNNARVFIATKMEPDQGFVKVVGFYQGTKGIDFDSIHEQYSDLINKTDKNKFVELLIPGNNIEYVRNLTFRQK